MTFKKAAGTGEKIDEDFYPPESAIKPEFIKRVKKAQADIAAGKGKMDFGRSSELVSLMLNMNSPGKESSPISKIVVSKRWIS